MSDCFHGSIVLRSYQQCMKCRFPCIFTSVSGGSFVVFNVLASVKWILGHLGASCVLWNQLLVRYVLGTDSPSVHGLFIFFTCLLLQCWQSNPGTYMCTANTSPLSCRSIFWVFETGFVLSKLALNLLSSCLCFLTVGITGVRHYIGVPVLFS